MKRFKINKYLLLASMIFIALGLIAWTTNPGSLLWTGEHNFQGPVTFQESPDFDGGINGEQITDDTIDDDSIDFTDVTISDFTDDTTGSGAVATVTGLALAETGSPELHKTVFTLTDVSVALTDDPGADAYLGQKIYDFPAGAIMTVGATADLDLTLSAAGVDADWNGDFGLGTATAAADNTLTSTEDDILPSTATPQATASVSTANGQSTAAENVVFDGTSTAKDLYLNLLVDDADQDVTTTPTNMIFNGTITVYWINLGDY